MGPKNRIYNLHNKVMFSSAFVCLSVLEIFKKNNEHMIQRVLYGQGRICIIF